LALLLIVQDERISGKYAFFIQARTLITRLHNGVQIVSDPSRNGELDRYLLDDHQGWFNVRGQTPTCAKTAKPEGMY
jgi:hypothetical protein